MKHALLFAASALLVAAPGLAQQTVALTGKAYVVKQVPDGTGKLKNTLAAPERVLPGEPLVFTLEYKNNGTAPAAAFVINNPIPANVIFTAVEQPWADVSVDGGKSFGKLAALKVAKGDGTFRPAQPTDVTHVRWKFAQPIAPAASGTVTYYGVVK